MHPVFDKVDSLFLSDHFLETGHHLFIVDLPSKSIES